MYIRFFSAYLTFLPALRKENQPSSLWAQHVRHRQTRTVHTTLEAINRRSFYIQRHFLHIQTFKKPHPLQPTRFDTAYERMYSRISSPRSFRSFSSPSFTRTCNSAKDQRAACGCVATHTTSHGTGIFSQNDPKNVRMRRFKRLRTTAEPILREATIPMRCVSEANGRPYTTSPCKRTLTPSRYNARKSLFLRSRCSRFTHSVYYTCVSLRRPFRRRALITERPPLVAIRARNPHMRTRFSFDG